MARQKKRTFTIMMGMEGKIVNKIVWDARNAVGESLLRLTLDELIGFGKCKAQEQKCSYDISISDEEHELLFVSKADSEMLTVYIDGEEQGEVENTCTKRFDAVIRFIGFDMK